MMYKIVTLPGDGIGPEIMEQGVAVLDAVANKFGFQVQYAKADIGGVAIDNHGTPLPQDTFEKCKAADAVLLGAVGGPKWDHLDGDTRPEKGLLNIRAGLDLFANLRPAIVYNALRGASPLKDEILGDGLDILMIRELTGGIYFGERGRTEVDGMPAVYDTEYYTKAEIERVVHVAFRLAGKRGKHLYSIDKANVMESSRMWRETVNALAAEYSDITVEHMYVDNAAMQLVRNPRQFDTVVTNNMFGDILSDEASQITGSIGMLPSASLGAGNLGLYEPIHGSAPDIAGQGIANPIAMVLSVAMMLRYSLAQPEAADAIEAAVNKVLEDGLRTADLAQEGEKILSTSEMGQAILERLV